MAHIRVRNLQEKLKKIIKQSPSVCLLGMRQTGKTTLIKQNSNSYFTLDDDQTLSNFRDGDWSILEKAKTPIALDECQKLPTLFDRIKMLIDQKKQMGRYFLTGSVRFLSKKQIKESLTGRTLILELLPLTVAESHSKDQSSFIFTLLESTSFHQFTKIQNLKSWVTLEQINHQLTVGGLPGICFKRDIALRSSMFEQQFETLLSRDLPMLYQSRVSIQTLKNLLKLVALKQGEKLSMMALAKQTKISAPTVQSLLRAFEGLFILRSNRDRYYFEDAGMINFLMKQEYQTEKSRYEGFIFRELTAVLKYQFYSNAELNYYETRGGVDIPFVFTVDQKHICAFTFDPQDHVSEKSLKSLGKFKKIKPNGKTVAFFLGDEPYEASNGVWCIPLTWLP